MDSKTHLRVWKVASYMSSPTYSGAKVDHKRLRKSEGDVVPWRTYDEIALGRGLGEKQTHAMFALFSHNTLTCV